LSPIPQHIDTSLVDVTRIDVTIGRNLAEFNRKTERNRTVMQELTEHWRKDLLARGKKWWCKSCGRDFTEEHKSLIVLGDGGYEHYHVIHGTTMGDYYCGPVVEIETGQDLVTEYICMKCKNTFYNWQLVTEGDVRHHNVQSERRGGLAEQCGPVVEIHKLAKMFGWPVDKVRDLVKTEKFLRVGEAEKIESLYGRNLEVDNEDSDN